MRQKILGSWEVRVQLPERSRAAWALRRETPTNRLRRAPGRCDPGSDGKEEPSSPCQSGASGADGASGLGGAPPQGCPLRPRRAGHPAQLQQLGAVCMDRSSHPHRTPGGGFLLAPNRSLVGRGSGDAPWVRTEQLGGSASQDPTLGHGDTAGGGGQNSHRTGAGRGEASCQPVFRGPLSVGDPAGASDAEGRRGTGSAREQGQRRLGLLSTRRKYTSPSPSRPSVRGAVRADTEKTPDEVTAQQGTAHWPRAWRCAAVRGTEMPRSGCDFSVPAAPEAAQVRGRFWCARHQGPFSRVHSGLDPGHVLGQPWRGPVSPGRLQEGRGHRLRTVAQHSSPRVRGDSTEQLHQRRRPRLWPVYHPGPPPPDRLGPRGQAERLPETEETEGRGLSGGSRRCGVSLHTRGRRGRALPRDGGEMFRVPLNANLPPRPRENDRDPRNRLHHRDSDDGTGLCDSVTRRQAGPSAAAAAPARKPTRTHATLRFPAGPPPRKERPLHHRSKQDSGPLPSAGTEGYPRAAGPTPDARLGLSELLRLALPPTWHKGTTGRAETGREGTSEGPSWDLSAEIIRAQCSGLFLRAWGLQPARRPRPGAQDGAGQPGLGQKWGDPRAPSPAPRPRWAWREAGGHGPAGSLDVQSGDAPNAPPPHAPAECPARPPPSAACERPPSAGPAQSQGRTQRYRPARGPGRWDPRSSSGRGAKAPARQARAGLAPSARSPRIPTVDPDPSARTRLRTAPSLGPPPPLPSRDADTKGTPPPTWSRAARAPGAVAPARPRQGCKRSARVWCRGRVSAPGSRRPAPAPRPEPPFLPCPASSRGAQPAGRQGGGANGANTRARSSQLPPPPRSAPCRPPSAARGRAGPGRGTLGSRGWPAAWG
ncbi:basic proline-rich protein-like [Phyllostomus discolor]|uniref:Basic proline-rich protein-like n=1 Tax=Phyllostomus discolor TaxID=89673 RepID=A0A6J2LUD0_9CHIR|nr:basic proline-rich protein-like [Phyllostomus discolor]